MLKLTIAFLLLFSLQTLGQWVYTNPGTTNDIIDISFPSPDTGYALDGSNGNLWKTLDRALQRYSAGKNRV